MEQIKETMEVYFTTRIITNENAPYEFQMKIYKDEDASVEDYNEFVVMDESYVSTNHKVAKLLESDESDSSVVPVIFASNSEGDSKMKVFREKAIINYNHEYVYAILATVVNGIDIIDTKLIVTTNLNDIPIIRSKAIKKLSENILTPDEVEVLIDTNATSRLRFNYKDIPDTIFDISVCKFSFEY